MKTFRSKPTFISKPPARVQSMAKKYGVLEMQKTYTPVLPKILFDGDGDYIGFSSYLVGENSTSWSLGFRIDQYTANVSTHYDFICGATGLDAKIVLSDAASQHVGFRGTSGGYFYWDGTGNTTAVTSSSLETDEHSLFFRADGTNVYLYVDGLDMGYITPTTTGFSFNKHMNGYYNTTRCVNAVSWDLRTWSSDVGDAQALLYNGGTIDDDADHQYSLEQLVTDTNILDLKGSIDGVLYGNPTNV